MKKQGEKNNQSQVFSMQGDNGEKRTYTKIYQALEEDDVA